MPDVFDGALELDRGDDEELPFIVTDGTATLSISGTPTGGTFTLAYEGKVTGAIAYNASSAVVQAALAALSTIPAGAVSCSGGALPGTAVVITFQKQLAGQDPGTLVADGSLLTGGTSVEVEVLGTRQNITGWSFWFTLKRDLGDADASAILQYTSAAGISITSAANGEGKVTIAAADWAATNPATLLGKEKTELWGDLQGKDGSSRIRTLWRGIVTVGGDVTRSTS